MDKQKTMFVRPKYEYLSNIISLRNPAASRGAVKELRREFKKAETHTKRLRIARATQLAANRASATLKRKNLSARERDEYRAIQHTYADAAGVMFSRL